MKEKILLLLLLFSTNGFSQQILKIGEVYDFDIGDEFHYKSNLGLPSGERLKVIEKSYSTNNDTVFYKFEYNNYTSTYYNDRDPHLQYSYRSGVTTASYTNLESSILANSCDCSYYLENDIFCKCDSIISTSWCGLEINGYSATVGEFEPSYYVYTYGKGIGMTREYRQYGSSGGIVDVDKQLVYYKKVDKSCGEPDLTSIPGKQVNPEPVKIFPNPTNSVINVETADNSTGYFTFELLNIQGKTMDHREIRGRSFQYDLSGFENGIYIVKIYNAENVSVSRIVKD